MPDVRINLIGQPSLSVDSRTFDPGPRLQRCVLAFLALNAPTGVCTASIIDAVWEHDAPEFVLKSVHKYVWGLRRSLGRETIRNTDDGYRLDVDPRRIDIRAVDEDARQAIAVPDAEARLDQLDAVTRRYAGQFLPGVDRRFVRAKRVALDEVRSNVFDARCRTAVELGRYNEVIGELSAALEGDEQREDRWALLADTLRRAGRRVEAIDVCNNYRRRLVGRGLEPGSDLDLVERLLFQ